MRSYRPEELFDPDRRLNPEFAALAPAGDRRMRARASDKIRIRQRVSNDRINFRIA
jgi:phosphoketolase